MQMNVVSAMVVMMAGAAASLPLSQTAGSAEERVQDALRFEATKVNLGPIPDNRNFVQTFAFVNTTGRAVEVKVDGCHFCELPTLDKGGKGEYQAGERGMVFVPINPAGRRGRMTATAAVMVVGLREKPVVLEVVTEVRPRVWFEAEQVFFGESVRGVGRKLAATVSGRKAGFVVEGVESDSAWLSATLGPARVEMMEEEPVVRYDVLLTVSPDAPLGAQQGTVRVRTNDAEALPAQCSVAVRVVGDVEALPETVRLGRVGAGRPFAAAVALRGRSGGRVSVREVDVAQRGGVEEITTDVQVEESGGSVVRVYGRAPAGATAYAEVRVSVRVAGASGEEETIAVPVLMEVVESAAGG